MKNLKVSTRLFGGFGMLLALLCAIAVLESTTRASCATA